MASHPQPGTSKLVAQPFSRIATKAVTIQSILGSSNGPERTLTDGVTTYQSYTSCAIFSSPAYGTIVVSIDVDHKWQQCANLVTANNESVQDYLGAPVHGPVSLKGGGTAVYFERGMITARADKRAFVTYGEIYLRYRNFGDVTSFLGLPVSDEEVVGNGRRSRFDAGEVCWRGDLGAFEVHGAIHDRFEALGGPAKFGFPVTNETQVFQNKKEVGRYNNFESGKSIYWSPATGAWDVYGAIKGKWDEYGGPNGALGFPTSGETDTPGAHINLPFGNPDANGRYNNFQNGIIVWHPAGPYAGPWPVFNLHFTVDTFVSSFDNIHVQAKVFSSYGQKFDNWIPSPDNYTSNPRVQHDLIPVIPVVHSDLSISVWFDGLGHHTIGKDERLGIYQATYNISNLWGLLEGPDHGPNQDHNSDYSFDCKFKVTTDLPVAPNTPWRKHYWWPFHNFSTPQLSWSQYAQTFSDVHDQESVIWHPFDHLFYSLAYEGVSANGNCFGMCLESIYAQYHRSIYGEPVFSNPFNQFPPRLLTGGTPGAGDGTLTNDINIKHGYQLGAEVISYFLAKFVSGETHDPVGCFQQSLASFQRGDMPLISLSKDYTFGGAHVVRPYEWNSQHKPWTIKVANPNTPASSFPDDNLAANVIKIDPTANTFSVDEAPGTTYTGGEWTGGRMFPIPYSIMCSPPVTPFWEVLNLLAAGTLIIMGDDGQTKQITDEAGHTYLTAQGGINEDAKTRIPNFAPVPLLHRDKIHVGVGGHILELLEVQPAQIYYMQRPPAIPKKVLTAPGKVHAGVAGHIVATAPAQTHAAAAAQTHAAAGAFSGASLVERKLPTVSERVAHGNIFDRFALSLAPPSIRHEVVTPNGKSYRWGMRTASMAVVATVPGSAAGHSDFIAVDSPGRPAQAVTISVAKGGAAKTASVQVLGPVMAGPANARLFEISNLPLGVEQGVTLSLDHGGEELLLHNPGPQVAISLRVQSGPQAAHSAARPSVMLEAGAVHRIVPSEWTPAKIASAPISLQILDKPGGTVLKQSQI